MFENRIVACACCHILSKLSTVQANSGDLFLKNGNNGDTCFLIFKIKFFVILDTDNFSVIIIIFSQQSTSKSGQASQN